MKDEELVEPTAPDEPEPERTLEQACAEDGHLFTDDGGCLRCPYVKKRR